MWREREGEGGVLRKRGGGVRNCAARGEETLPAKTAGKIIKEKVFPVSAPSGKVLQRIFIERRAPTGRSPY